MQPWASFHHGWWALLLCLFATPALAEGSGKSRWYGSLGLGWNYAEPMRLEETNGTIEFDFGLPAASVAIGIAPSSKWRFELEASHQENEPEILYFSDSDIEIDTDETDRFAATSFMFNAFRDFHFGTAFRPYLGLGIGPSKVRMRFNDLYADEAESSIIDDSAWTFAYQVTAGISVPLTKHLDLGIDYRYWQAPSVNLSDSSGNDIDSRQSTHSGWVRVLYRPGGNLTVAERYPTHPTANPKGFYFSTSLGGGWPVDTSLGNTQAMLDAFAIGPMGSIALGYSMTPRWRLELEVARRDNDSDIVDFANAAGESRTSGSVRADSLALNLTHRFRPAAAVSPLIGAGLGVTRTRYNIDLVTEDRPYLNDTATGGVFQWMLGFDMALNDRWTVTTDYRMWISSNMKVDQPDGTTLEAMHVVHSMAIGLRYSFSR